MKQSIVFLLFFIASIFTNLWGQNDIQKETASTSQKIYTQKELDSIIEKLRTYFYKSNYEKIIEEAPLLLANRTLAESSQIGGRLRSLLGNAFIQLDDTESAAEIFDSALLTAKRKKDTLNILSSYINLGNTYITADPEKAITYFKEGLENGKNMGNPGQVMFIYHNNLAELYIGTKNTKQAQYHLNQAIPLATHPDLANRKDEVLSTINHVQGAIHLLNKEYQKSITSTLKSIEIGHLKIDENYLLNNYKNLIDSYDQTGQYEALNVVRKKYDSLRDKKYEADKILQQQIAGSKFKVDKYQQELRASQLETQLSKQKASQNKTLLIYGAILGGLLILTIGTLLYSRRKRYKLLKDLRSKNAQYLEAKEDSEKLAKSNTKFLSTISHELRTPLYGIVGISSVLQKNPKLEEHQEDLKALKFSADYLLALVNDVLNLNKLESKAGQTLQKVPFCLKGLIHDIIQSFEFINKQNNNEVVAIIDPQIPPILLCDKTKISQVLMNLISNASKFTEDGTIEIRVTAQSIKESKVDLLFSIKDSGLGIPDEEQCKIFEEFAQVDSVRQTGGTGLGLPIVNKILRLLKSELSVESRPNEGSTFSFSVSIGIGNESDVIQSREAPVIERLSNKTVLIVDDNKINQVVTKKVLEQFGMQHNSAANGLEAVSKVQETTYDVILMDINMPVMNGMDASKKIRNLKIETPIIALTATSRSELEKDIVSYGINDTIVKPYNTDQLLELLLKYIA